MNVPRIASARLARGFAFAAFAFAIAPAGATAMSVPGDGSLSPRLAELAKPSLRSLPRAEQAKRLSLAPSGPGSLQRDGARVVVNLRFASGAVAALPALRAAGARILDVSGRYETVTAAVAPAALQAVGGVAGVRSVTESLAPIVSAAGCPGGAVTSEGDAQLNAASARAAFGVDGSGVTVGILSDSFDRRAAAATRAGGDVASGDLPGPGNPCGFSTPVGVLNDGDSGGTDEGRGMAQIVHDLAPGARIEFASAVSPESELAFADEIRALRASGASVIVDDLSYLEEPFFQDGPVAVAAGEVSAAGASYFSAAGNNNLIDKGGNDIASWEAPELRDTACPPALVTAAETEHCMDFNPGVGADPTFGITVAKGATLRVDLQWAEPWDGVKTDLDAFLLNSEGNPLKVKKGSEEPLVDSVGNNLKSQRPVEILPWKNETGSAAKVQLAINDCFGAKCNPEVTSPGTPRLKFALMENGAGVTETEYPESSGGDTVGPTISGHAGAEAAIAVAAVPFNDSTEPEPYSSRGPVTHYFGPVTGTVAAAEVPAQTIPKPDLTATDCGATTFFGSFVASEGTWRFCGTSAAAPHAAAVAALVRQANPGASAAQVRVDLADSALPVGSFGPDDVGAGLIDAYGAVDALALAPTIAITQAPPALSRNRRPTIQFTANRPVSFTCAIDGGPPQPCSSPFTVPAALSDGQHGIAVSGVDLGGRTGTSPVASFSIDTKPPQTTIAKHPRKLIRTRHRKTRVAFRFRSNETPVVFVCKFDRELLRFCKPRVSRRLEAGRHTLEVRAEDAAGNVDRTPALFHFQVKRVG
jgi:hypothetical protein